MFSRIFASRYDGWWIAAAAMIVALISARPFAGAWNDGSRLAAVESLAERDTFVIDDSIFIRVPADRSPYDPVETDLQRHGTLDRLLIHGHYYSDKSPVPSLMLAIAAKTVRIAGIRASGNPRLWCWWMNFFGAGLPYAAAAVGMFRIGKLLNLPRAALLTLTTSFSIGSIALPYARHVNNHVQLLAVVTWIIVCMLELSSKNIGPAPVRTTLLLSIGALAGLGYTIDLGTGPILLTATGTWLLWDCRKLNSWSERVKAIVSFSLAALPWFLVHHVVNYAIAGTIGPANAVAEYLRWPGSPFDTSNMTGRWQHDSFGHVVIYCLDMLGGQKGILGHNLPLYLALFAVPWLFRCDVERSILVWSVGFCALAFLAYAVTSNNYAGRCVSIRWFVPFLAPGYLILAWMLKHRPEKRLQLLPLAAAAAVWNIAAWTRGPWHTPTLYLYWICMVVGMIGWAAVALHQAPMTRRLAKHLLRIRIRIPNSISSPGSE
jgi:hypothetical protein